MAIFHPASKIFIWLALALILPSVTEQQLAWLMLGISALLLILRPPGIFRRLWRMRWLWLGIVLVYGLSQPLIVLSLGWWDGMIQAARIMALVLAYAVLLGRASTDQLLSGMYALLSPLRHAGVPVRQLVLRLGLTIAYVETIGQIRWRDMLQLDQLLEDLPELSTQLVLDLPRWHLRDMLLVLTTLLFLGWWL